MHISSGISHYQATRFKLEIFQKSYSIVKGINVTLTEHFHFIVNVSLSNEIFEGTSVIAGVFEFCMRHLNAARAGYDQICNIKTTLNDQCTVKFCHSRDNTVSSDALLSLK